MSASSQSLGLAESQDIAGPGVSNQAEPEFEMEDPGDSWITLVEACRLPDTGSAPHGRRANVNALLFKAKNSHWTRELWESTERGYDSPTMGGDADEGGDYSPAQHALLDYEQQKTLEYAEAHGNARTKVTARSVCPYCGGERTLCMCYPG